MNFDNFASFIERHYDDMLPDGSIYVKKGLIGQQGKYHVTVRCGDHEPPHVHIEVNNKHVGSYLIADGSSYRIYHQDKKIDNFAKFWFKNENNQKSALDHWARLAGNRK